MKDITKGSFVLLFLITSVIYMLRVFGVHSALEEQIMYLFPPTIAVIMGFKAARSYGLGNSSGQIVGIISLGMCLLLLGEITWFIYDSILHIDPYPSIADVFYLAAYPVLFIGLIRQVLTQKIVWDKSERLQIILGVLCTILLASIVLYFGAYLPYDPAATFAENSIKIAYGFTDLFLIIPALFILKIVVDFRGGKLFYSWFFIFLALLLRLAADILFAIFTDQFEMSLWPYTLIDLVWVASYLVFAYGFFTISWDIKEAQRKLMKK